MLRDFLETVGLKGSVIIAACGGSLARIGIFGLTTAGNKGAVISTILNAVAGTIVGVYLGPVGPAYLGWPDDGKNTLAVTCVVALLGVEICKQLQRYATTWLPNIRRGSNGNGNGNH